MKHIYNYTNFRINEEFISNIINFLKNQFKKVATEIQKLNDDPNKIKEYVVNNLLNTKSTSCIFKKQIDDFRAKKDDSDQACFAFIDSILNKNTGALGNQGIGLLFNSKLLQGDKMKTRRLTLEYIINNARDQIIKKLKYDQKKDISRAGKGFKDKNYLPGFKQMLLKNTGSVPTKPNPNDKPAANPGNTNNGNTSNNNTNQQSTTVGNVNASIRYLYTNVINEAGGADASKNIENVINWVNTNITSDMINTIQAMKEDDIKAAISKGGGTAMGEYKVGDVVRYKMKDFIEGTEPEQQKDKIGSKPIARIEGDNYYFKDKAGKEFVKTKDQIIGKAEGNEADGAEAPEVPEIKDKLGQIKTDAKKMNTINKVIDLLATPDGEQKINGILPAAA